MKYQKIPKELIERIEADRIKGVSNPYACSDENIIRRKADWDRANLWRPAFVRDIEKILHSPYYNRYTDKTQVFSFYRNDDITRRALHVQLVSRIARNIGRVLGLNEDLIEAISLGHDIGHTPFGHAGERFLNEIYHEKTGRYFYHNVHSVRVLDQMFRRNISLQVLDGILCHNGEFEMKEYRPVHINGFKEYDMRVTKSYEEETCIDTLISMTLEGCVVRLSDMIAYIGKDRQDAVKANILESSDIFSETAAGKDNAVFVNNMVVNLIVNSYGKDYLLLDEEYYQALKISKKENYTYIYKNSIINDNYNKYVKPMFWRVYEKLLKDLQNENESSVIYKHHINYVQQQMNYYVDKKYLDETENNQIIVDYIASMTDDYFIDLYQYLFPNESYNFESVYVSYFNKY